MYKPDLAIEAKWVPDNLVDAANQVEMTLAHARCGCPMTTDASVYTLEVCLRMNEQTLQAAGLAFGEGIQPVRAFIESQQGNTSLLRNNPEFARLPELLRAAAADRARLLVPLMDPQAE